MKASKNFFAILICGMIFALVFAALFVACEPMEGTLEHMREKAAEENGSSALVPGVYRIDPITLTLPAASGGMSPPEVSVVHVSGNKNDIWTLSIDEAVDWLRFSLNSDGSENADTVSGSGASTPVYLVVDNNDAIVARSAGIYLNDTAVCEITQMAASGVYEVDPVFKSLPQTASGASLDYVTVVRLSGGSTDTWTLSTDYTVSWLTFSFDPSGAGAYKMVSSTNPSAPVYLKVSSANTDTAPRTANIYIDGIPLCVVTQACLPPLSGTVSISGIPQLGRQLTANTSGLNGSGTISYQWNRDNGETITNIGTNSNTYTVVNADVGSILSVTLTRPDCSGSLTSNPTDTIIIPTLSGSVTITGSAVVGQTLTANTGSLGGYGTISYQWKRGTTNVGTNSSTYTVVSADLGNKITVTVSRLYSTGTVTSTATANVANPALSGTVTITGNARVGCLLTANTSGVSGTGTLSYQWKRITNGVISDIGTDKNTYTIVPSDNNGYDTSKIPSNADEYSFISVTVTRAGYSGSVTSAKTSRILPFWNSVWTYGSGSGTIYLAWDKCTSPNLPIGSIYIPGSSAFTLESIGKPANWGIDTARYMTMYYVKKWNGPIGATSSSQLTTGGDYIYFEPTSETQMKVTSVSSGLASTLNSTNIVGKTFTRQ